MGMGYWWQNIIIKNSIRGKTILKFNGEGCQAIGVFQWVGKVTGFERNKSHKCDDIVIEIIKHNFSYGDSRDRSREKEIYKYPLVNADIQCVDGVWILFT